VHRETRLLQDAPRWDIRAEAALALVASDLSSAYGLVFRIRVSLFLRASSPGRGSPPRASVP